MTLSKPLPESKSTVTGGVDSPELLPFHPSANVFDLMEGEEFDELVADIKRRGLRIPIVTHKGQIVDGRNRARACALAGVPPRYQEFDGSDEDVDRYIISMNIHRRHLAANVRRDALVKLLKLHPEKSDRAIAEETGFSHTTVQKARKTTGNSVASYKRTGKDGRSRRMPTQAKKKPKTTEVDSAPTQAMPPKTNGAAVPALPPPAEATQQDVDPKSPQAKFERDNFIREHGRLEHLESEVHRLKQRTARSRTMSRISNEISMRCKQSSRYQQHRQCPAISAQCCRPT